MVHFALMFIAVALIIGAVNMAGIAPHYQEITSILSPLFLLIGLMSLCIYKLTNKS